MKVKLQALRRQYELLQMEEAESVVDYFNHVQTITNHMKTNGEVMIDLVIIEKILRTLTQRFDHIVVAIDEPKEIDTLKVVKLQAKTSKQAFQAQVDKKANQDEGKYKKGKGKSKWHKKKDSNKGVGNSKNQNSGDNYSKKNNGNK
uniref:Uncharacterized protein LOC105851294 n=1 Tax=Cicer arietinum TaxID=3827 RepID=A0A1S3DWB3_CICAR|nr:uncharacterized protein LOC105851294 [Cicer arietinum]